MSAHVLWDARGFPQLSPRPTVPGGVPCSRFTYSVGVVWLLLQSNYRGPVEWVPVRELHTHSVNLTGRKLRPEEVGLALHHCRRPARHRVGENRQRS